MCIINEIKKHIVHYRVLNTESSINKNSCFFYFFVWKLFLLVLQKKPNPRSITANRSIRGSTRRSEQSMLGQYNTRGCSRLAVNRSVYKKRVAPTLLYVSFLLTSQLEVFKKRQGEVYEKRINNNEEDDLMQTIGRLLPCWEWSTTFASIARRTDSETKQIAFPVIVRCQSLTDERVSGGLRFR